MKTLALLIDGDNAQLKNTKHILQFCQSYGTLKIKRAYGDWEKTPLSSHSQIITKLGIKLVPQNRVTPNATDFRLAMDVGAMIDKHEADIYIIVSSDNHFTVVCEQIRQKGAQVIGIGSKNSVSRKLRKACNEFYNIEKIIENQSKPSVSTSTSSQSKVTPKPTNTSQPKAKPKPLTAVEPQSKPIIKVATVPKSKAASKSKAVVQPKLEAKPKAVPKLKAEAKPKIASKLEPKAKVKVDPQPKAEPNRAALLEILINTYQSAAPQKEGWVNFAQLGGVRPQLKQKFGPGFASKPLSSWFKDFEEFDVELDRVRLK